MRYLLPALVLLVIITGASTLIPLEFRPPAPRGGYPPAPSAAEESGMVDTEVAQVVPAGPPSGRQVQPRGPAARHRVPSVSVSPQPPAAQRAGSEPAPTPVAPMRDHDTRSRVGPRRIRDPGAGTEPGLPDEHQAGGEPGATAMLPQAGLIAGAPILTPPVLQTPVAGYPAEGYRVVVDRAMLTPRLRIEAAQGRVVLRIRVRPDGSVAQVDVVESSGVPVLDQAAARAAAGWIFTPATRDGEPIDAWAVIPVRFVVP